MCVWVTIYYMHTGLTTENETLKTTLKQNDQKGRREEGRKEGVRRGEGMRGGGEGRELRGRGDRNIIYIALLSFTFTFLLVQS